MSRAARDEHRTPVGFWIGLALGAPVIAYGLRGALDALPGVQLTSAVRWFVGAAVVHDLLLGPVVCLVGWLLARRLPAVAAAPFQAAALASGFVGVVAVPFLRTDGATVGEPSFLARDYATSMFSVWAAIWAVALVAVAVRMRTGRESARRAGDRPRA